MDKFGIFKLLSALNNSNQATGDSDNPLQSILNSLSKSQKEEQKPQTPSQAEPQKHLSSPLLDTIRTHDEIVRRINKNNR